MKINVQKIPTFCLTCENETGNKRKMIQYEFANMNNRQGPEFINPILVINGEKTPKNKSGASGFIRMIEEGLMRQTPGEPFVPFILLEDDVSFLYESCKHITEIDVPENSDILYIGLSCCSMNAESFHYNTYYELVDGYPHIMRIKHMLASHGIMVCSALGAAALQRTMMETWFSDRPWDVPLAYIQPYYHVYGLREPLIYQNEERGGDASCTRITIDGNGCVLPFEYINCDLATIFLPNKRLV